MRVKGHPAFFSNAELKCLKVQNPASDSQKRGPVAIYSHLAPSVKGLTVATIRKYQHINFMDNSTSRIPSENRCILPSTRPRPTITPSHPALHKTALGRFVQPRACRAFSPRRTGRFEPWTSLRWKLRPGKPTQTHTDWFLICS